MESADQRAQSKDPLLTRVVYEQLIQARDGGRSSIECSLDLGRSHSRVEIAAAHWRALGNSYPYPARCKDRTIYYWSGSAFEPAARYTGSLVKLVPTQWGPPTFEIDGIKMLPTARISPYLDAQHKVDLVKPRGKRILDTCGGLGYFAAWCLERGAREIFSYERNADVIWLRGLNPWSPAAGGPLTLACVDVLAATQTQSAASFDAILHDPPRFGIAGELYSSSFYARLARLLKPRGTLFHYTGTPNKLTSGRDVPREVMSRLQQAGFAARIEGDGVLATK